ncbi:MAG: hypothetical protein FWG15_06760 [Propionibacteriaceae bacterium]|nr:hypothetical protein [Propionibacteriaceae bacterium]
MKYLFKVIVVATFMAFFVMGLSAQAHAEPLAPHVQIEWNGPITSLSWDSSSYGIAGDTFVGHLVAVPGDRVERTAVIRNDGPSDAIVTVQILNVTTTNSSSTVNTELEEIIELHWNVNGSTGVEPWKDLREARDPAGVSRTVTFPLAHGAQFPMTLGFLFPSDSTGGRNLGEESSRLSFEVRIIMTGEAGGVENPPPPSSSGDPGMGGGGVMVAPTGGTTDESSSWVVCVLLSLGGALGVTAILVRRASVAQR